MANISNTRITTPNKSPDNHSRLSSTIPPNNMVIFVSIICFLFLQRLLIIASETNLNGGSLGSLIKNDRNTPGEVAKCHALPSCS